MTATRKILELNAFDMQAAAGLDPETADLVARRRRVFGPASMLFYARPLNLVRGEGVWLIGADGTRYLDAYNNVASVGHCHPRVVAPCRGKWRPSTRTAATSVRSSTPMRKGF